MHKIDGKSIEKELSSYGTWHEITDEDVERIENSVNRSLDPIDDITRPDYMKNVGENPLVLGEGRSLEGLEEIIRGLKKKARDYREKILQERNTASGKQK